MPTGGRLLAIGVFALMIPALGLGQLAVTGNIGIVISEIGHGPTLTQRFQQPWPSYIELINLQAAAGSNVPAPVTVAPNTGTLIVRVGNATPTQLTFQQALVFGATPQDAPAPPVAGPNPPSHLLISDGPFPPGVLTTTLNWIVAPSLFSGASAQMGAAGVPFEICVNGIGPHGDRVFFVAPSATANCPGASFALRQPVPLSPQGVISRWTYIDSNTDWDFDTAFPPSPGRKNPEMAHANGFIFGDANQGSAPGAPLNFNTSSQLATQAAGAIVRGVNFLHHPMGTGISINRTIVDPAFDPVVSAPLVVNFGFSAQAQQVAGVPNFLPGLQVLGSSASITVSPAPGQVGTLILPSGPSSFQGATLQPGAGGHFRIERLYSDGTADSAPVGIGQISVAEADVIPASTGGGNIWCEVIVYDYAGNQYRAKVRNWPSGGGCGTPPAPLLALGTDGFGTGTLVDMCFDGNAKVFNLFSLTPAGSCGGPLFPVPSGICFDGVTLLCITSFVGIPPIDTVTDANGIYAWQSAPGQFTSLAGLTFEAIAVQYTLAPAIVQYSSTNTITF